MLRQSLGKAGIIINSQRHCADTGIHLDSLTAPPAAVTANTLPSSHLINQRDSEAQLGLVKAAPSHLFSWISGLATANFFDTEVLTGGPIKF